MIKENNMKYLNDVVNETRELLISNKEWRLRYADYAEKISNNLEVLRKIRQSFRQWKPLMVYLNVSNAKRSSTITLELRYRGQTIADLICKNSCQEVIINSSKYNKNNKRDFGCDIVLDKEDWKGLKAREFRKFFKTNPIRENIKNKGNEEHRIESMLLTEFSKKSSNDKTLLNIQPVKIANFRFPMPTPLSASDHKKVKYSASYGGGIDLLARIGTGGRATYLCIMELKDENKKSEPPLEALKQSLVYTTFIRELLRSESGLKWWRLFGFKQDIPKKINLYSVCAMPSNSLNDKSFEDKEIKIDNDIIKLNYIYFIEEDNIIKNFDTSLYIKKL